MWSCFYTPIPSICFPCLIPIFDSMAGFHVWILCWFHVWFQCLIPLFDPHVWFLYPFSLFDFQFWEKVENFSADKKSGWNPQLISNFENVLGPQLLYYYRSSLMSATCNYFELRLPDCLRPFWLAEVITLILVLRHSIETRSITLHMR